MAGSPTDLVIENTDVSVVCRTDEGNPTPTVRWYRDGQTVPVDTDLETLTVEVTGGQYNANYVESTLRIQTDRTLNEKVYICKVESTSLERTFTLGVKFPHNVEVIQSPSDSVVEDASLTLTCEATGGNPTKVLSYNWSFAPRYGESSELSSDTQRELQFDSVEYTQAGVYTCEANNSGGTNSGSKEVLIKFAPVDVSSPIQKITYAETYERALLNCTVWAYPAITSNHVIVMFHGSEIPSDSVSVQAVNNKVDETLIELTFDSVTADDFGVYEVMLNNGVKDDVIVRLNLTEQGPPQPPHSLMTDSVTAVSVTISWLGGRNGGSAQTFSVMYQKESGSSTATIPDIPDPGPGLRVTYTITGLEPETAYLFKIMAENSYGKSKESSSVSNETLEGPKLTEAPVLTIFKDIGLLEWPVVEGLYSHSAIEKCEKERHNCLVIQNITLESHTYLVLQNDYLDYDYFFVVYQDDDEVLRQIFTVLDNRSPETQMNHDTGNSSTYTGLAAGLGVVCTIAGLLCVVIITILYRLYKNGGLRSLYVKSKISEEKNQVSYENVIAKEETVQYEMTQAEAKAPPAEYTDLKYVTYEVVGK